MQVVTYPDFTPIEGHSIVTMGSFDGVHWGHRTIFGQLQQEAKKRNLVSVIITFTPHPRQVLQPETSFEPINTPEEKVALIGREKIDYLLIIPFTKEFASWSPEKFIQEILIKRLHTKAMVMGPHHAFGKNRTGTHVSIQNYCREMEIDLIEIPEVVRHNNAVRSTLIRQYLHEKEYDKASELLGYPYKK